MTARATITLRKKSNAEGDFPLAVRITKDRKTTYCYVGQNIPLRHWDEKNKLVRKSNPHATYLNGLLLAKLGEINRTLLKLELDDSNYTIHHLKKELPGEQLKLNFHELAKIHL